MPREIFKVQDAQTIYDIALSTHGSMEGVIDLLVANNLNFDTDLPATITYDVQDNYIVKYLKGVGINTGGELLPVTAISLVYTNTGNGDSEVVDLTPSTLRAYQIKDEQSIFDIVTMVTGNMTDVIDILLLNNLSFDIPLVTGATIKYNGNRFLKAEVATGTPTYQLPKHGFSKAFSKGYDGGNA